MQWLATDDVEVDEGKGTIPEIKQMTRAPLSKEVNEAMQQEIVFMEIDL